jgi:hypothetical protein
MNSEDEPTISEIVDLGGLEPEPSENYLESLNMLDNVVRECMQPRYQ